MKEEIPDWIKSRIFELSKNRADFRKKKPNLCDLIKKRKIKKRLDEKTGKYLFTEEDIYDIVKELLP